MNVQYIGPFDSVEIPGVGHVARGGSISVSSEVAGHPASSQYRATHSALLTEQNAQKRASLRRTLSREDAGSGLLAQHDCWQPTPAAPISRPTQKAAAKRAATNRSDES